MIPIAVGVECESTIGKLLEYDGHSRYRVTVVFIMNDVVIAS